MATTKSGEQTRTNVEVKGKFTCDVCDRSFNRKDTVQRHSLQVHGQAWVDSKPLLSKTKCLYPECDLIFYHKLKMLEHLKDHNDAIGSEVTHHSFGDHQEFMAWKLQEEKENNVYFRKEYGTVTSKGTKCCHYICKKDGPTKPSRARNQPDEFCPARMKVVTCLVTRIVSVTYFRTHSHFSVSDDTVHNPISTSIRNESPPVSAIEDDVPRDILAVAANDIYYVEVVGECEIPFVQESEPTGQLQLRYEQNQIMSQAQTDKDDPTVVVPNLCRILQGQGHMVGSSGAISMTRDGKTYFTPSGVLKENIQPEDLFIYQNSTPFHSPPPAKKLKRSSNSPLFEVIFDKTDADTGIHTHCMSSNLITQVIPGNEVRIQNQEMIKGIAKCKSGGMYKNTDELIIPIVENLPEEEDLVPAVSEAIEDYPETCAVLVRNHGIYVWGKSWQKTKIMYECYCYLFDLMIKMRQLGIQIS